jgi:hypothetical protein
LAEDLEFSGCAELLIADKDAEALEVLEEVWGLVFEAAFACCAFDMVFLLKVK